MSEVLLTTDKLYKLKTEIEKNLNDIKSDSNMVKELKATMADKYKALPGYIQEILNNNDNNVQRLNEKEVYIVSKEMYSILGARKL
nr:hypothetical protein [Bacillus velezensis]